MQAVCIANAGFGTVQLKIAPICKSLETAFEAAQ
jgi:hypothetical protein